MATDPVLDALNEQIKNLESTLEELVESNEELIGKKGGGMMGMAKMLGGPITMGLSVLTTALTSVTSVFLQSLTMYDKVETELRKNSFSLSKNLQTAENMSIVMGEMVNSLDAAKFMMVSQRTGLDQNSKELQGLFKTVQDLGGDFGMFTAQLRQSTIGTESSSDALIKTLEGTTKATNISRENLIKALDSVSTEMVNMMSAVSVGGAEGVQKSAVILRGVLRDPTLFRGAMASISQMVQAGGFQTAALTGTTDLRKQMFQDTGPGAAIEATIRMGQAAQRIADQVKGSELGPEILEGFQNIPGMMNIGQQIRVLEQMRDFARDELGLSESELKDTKILSEAIQKDIQTKKDADEKMVRSLDSLKREIFAPFVNAMAGFGKEIKAFLDLNKDVIADMMPMVANIFKNVGMAIINGIINLLNWLGSTDLAQSLREVQVEMKSLRVATAEENLKRDSERTKAERKERMDQARENMLKAQDLSLKLQIKQTYRVIDLLERGNSHSEEIRRLTQEQKSVVPVSPDSVSRVNVRSSINKG